MLNKKKNNVIENIVLSGLIAAFYAALTYISAALGIAYGPVQFRLSEALMCLALLSPSATVGLTVGCVLGNITSPLGLIDIFLGATATLIAAVIIRLISKLNWKFDYLTVPFITAIANGIIVGLEITFFLPEGFSFAGFLLNGGYVAIGEFAVVSILGIPLTFALRKYKKAF